MISGIKICLKQLIMNDTVIATAILDRLLHHAHIINIRGDSYRLKSLRDKRRVSK